MLLLMPMFGGGPTAPSGSTAGLAAFQTSVLVIAAVSK